MNEIQVPQEYVDKSNQLVKIYDDFIFSGESLDKLITEMREILVDSGFSKTQAMMKISEDHRHLRGFSLNNIYKVLPTEKKQSYVQKELGQIENSSSKEFYQTGKNEAEKEDEFQNKIPPEREPPIMAEPNMVSAYDIKQTVPEPTTETQQQNILQLKEQDTREQLLQEERIKSQNLTKQLEQTKNQLEQKTKEYDQLNTKLAQFQEIKEIDLGLDELVPFRVLVNPAASTNRIPSITPLDQDFLKKIKRKLGH